MLVFGGTAWALFSATTVNSANNLTAGSLTLTDDDGNNPMLTLSNQKPGDTDTRCISLTYAGTARASVLMYGSTSGTGLDANIGVQITRGTMPAGSFNACTGFTADTRVHMPGQTAGVVYAGSLADFPDTAATAIYDTPANIAWTNGEVHAFKVQTWTGGNRAAEGKNVTQSFTWQAQGIASNYDSTVLATSGLVSYWRLNELSGTSVADSKGTNRGSYRRGVQLGQSGRLTGETNKAATFDGVDDHIVLGTPASLQLPAFSIEAWFKTTASSFQTIVRSRVNGYALLMEADGRIIGRYWEGGGGNHDSASVLSYNDGLWHHAVYAKDNLGANLHIDGKIVGGDASIAPVGYANGEVAIGRDGDLDGSYFSGSIDEVAIYNRALSYLETEAHYDAR